MLERFTEQARQVVVRARQEAVSLGHSAIQAEHLLLGLLGEPDGVVSEVFTELQITIESVREKVVARQNVERLRPGPGTIPDFHQLPFSPRATKVLELSLRESLARGEHRVGAEHLLLAIARVDDGGAAEILRALGADGERLRSEVLKRLPDVAPRTVEAIMGGASTVRVRRGPGRAPAIALSATFTVMPDPVLERLLMRTAGVALGEERTTFGVNDLLLAVLRDAEMANLLREAGANLDALRERLQDGPPGAG